MRDTPPPPSILLLFSTSVFSFSAAGKREKFLLLVLSFLDKVTEAEFLALLFSLPHTFPCVSGLTVSSLSLSLSLNNNKRRGIQTTCTLFLPDRLPFGSFRFPSVFSLSLSLLVKPLSPSLFPCFRGRNKMNT